uniref:Uncharacterized protein n=1 Tax=Sinocyclocheilus grahami TaxID=75366 RepID=A0A672QY35_SINGR
PFIQLQCDLVIFSDLLSDCSISEEGYKALASALRSNPSHLIELDLRGNDPGQSGVKQLSDLLQDPNCQLKTLSLRKCGLTEESCSALATVLRSNSSLKALDMRNNNLQDSGVKKLQNGLENTNCTLQKLRLSDCSITEEGYKALASALRSNPSHLIELDLTGNDPGQSGVKQLDDLLQDPDCQLKTLRLSNCELTEKSCSVLATVLSSKTILKEMNLNNSRLLDSGVKEICEGLKNPVCELEILKLSNCGITEEGYLALASALRSNPSHLIELDLTGNDPGPSGVEQLNDLLQDPDCQLKTLRLNNCKLTEKSCSVLATVLSSKTILKEMNLNNSRLLDSGVKEICEGLRKPVCELKILKCVHYTSSYTQQNNNHNNMV